MARFHFFPCNYNTPWTGIGAIGRFLLLGVKKSREEMELQDDKNKNVMHAGS